MGFQEHGLAFQVVADGGRGHGGGGGATAAPWWATTAQGFAAKFPISFSSGKFPDFGRLCYHDWVYKIDWSAQIAALW